MDISTLLEEIQSESPDLKNHITNYLSCDACKALNNVVIVKNDLMVEYQDLSKLLSTLFMKTIKYGFRHKKYYQTLIQVLPFIHPHICFKTLCMYLNPDFEENVRINVVKLLNRVLYTNEGLKSVIINIFSTFKTMDNASSSCLISRDIDFILVAQTISQKFTSKDFYPMNINKLFSASILEKVLSINDCQKSELCNFFMEIFTKLVSHTEGQVWETVLMHPDINDFIIENKCLLSCKSKFLERNITHLFIHCCDTFKVQNHIKYFTTDSMSLEKLINILKRLLFVRQIRQHYILVNIFKALYLLCQKDTKESLDRELVDKFDSLLGLEALKIWADEYCIGKCSINQRLYSSITVASWIIFFRIPLSKPFHDICETVLSGISNHLSASRNEVRFIGMCLGEFIMNRCQLQEHIVNSDNYLKFDYPDTEEVKVLKSYFLNDSDQVPPNISSVDELSAKDEKEAADEELDSDDDSDDSDASFVPLRSFNEVEKIESVPGWPPSNYRPRYVRECLEGLQMTKPEDCPVFLGCIYAAEKLFYAHPSAVQDFSEDIIRALLYSTPPSSPYDKQVSQCRLMSMVAVLTIHPTPVAQYLTAEFATTNMTISLRGDILRALTQAACALSQTKYSCKSKTTSDVVKSGGSNLFAKFAGDFFFPLIKFAPKLIKNEEKAFRHQDRLILAQMVATLASIYACARHSPKRREMRVELVALSQALVSSSSEAYVRRAAITALGTVVSLPSDSGGGASDASLEELELRMEIAEQLIEVTKADLDEETQALAHMALASCVK